VGLRLAQQALEE
jgi:TLD